MSGGRRMKILFVSASFPPVGGMTPLLAAYLVRHWQERGHEVDVLTMQTSDRHPRYKLDPGMERFLPPGLRVVRTYPGPIHRAARHIVGDGRGLAEIRASDHRRSHATLRELLALQLRSLLIPDSRVDWVPWALAHGRRMLRSGSYDAIFSISPPDTDNVVGYLLARWSGLPWVVHQGDLWSIGPVTASQRLPAWRVSLERRMERRFMNRMDGIVVVSEGMKRMYSEAFGLPADNFTVATVGYDPEEYARIEAESSPTGRFRIAYTGSFYPGIREPAAFFEGFADFARGRTDVEFVIAGAVGSQYEVLARQLGLEDSIKFLGYVPHERAIALQKGAHALLLLGWVGGIGLTAKLIEYLAGRRPILAVSYDDLDPARALVTEQQRGIGADNDRSAIAGALNDLYGRWKNGALESSFDLREPREFTWDQIAGRIEGVLQQAVARRATVGAALQTTG